MTMRLLLKAGLPAALLLALAGSLAPSVASAQEVQVSGPLANQPAVRHMRLYREGRILLEPNFTFGLQSEFATPLVAGLHLGYYFTDWLGIGVWGGYAVANLNTGLTNEIESGGITTTRNRLSLPDRENFSEQIGRMTWVASVQLEFIPLRGKLAIFEKLFVDTDLYLFVGAAVVGLEERADVVGGECSGAQNPVCSASQTARATRVTPAITFGAGLSMYFNDFIGLNLNWRALPYSSNASGWDDADSDRGTDFGDGRINSDDRFFALNHMFTIGIQIYLPTDPVITD